jgi:hypothetical protein
VIVIEKFVSIPVRLLPQQAREFKIACAVEGVTAQDVLRKAVLEFTETSKQLKEKPE